MPFVSFIIPFYGSAALLKRALDSLAAQTDGDFEVIVVDDASPEGGAALVAQCDARFRYVPQPENAGPYQARVRGIGEARGAYVVGVDCDDYVRPELVAELRRALERSRADIVVYNVEQDAAGVITPHWCRYESGTYSSAEVMTRLADRRLQWNFWSKAFRRETILKTWKIEPRLMTARVLAPDDFCAVVPIVLCSERIEVIPYVGYRYWQGARSVCRGISPAKVMRAVCDTWHARRLVLAFASRIGCSPVIRSEIRLIARLIVRWWISEFLRTLKRRICR